jgi:hypothetical protein
MALAALPTACSDSSSSTGTLAPVAYYHEERVRMPDPERQGGHVGRAPRRLTVAQLQQTIQVATGQVWTELDSKAASLGQADFAVITNESAEPNLVFAKFLEEGARQVCRSAAAADFAAASGTARVLYYQSQLPASWTQLSAAEVDRNLVYLSTRFWGAPLSGEELASWAHLFRGVSARAEAAGKRVQALEAICLALMTDSRFFTY